VEAACGVGVDESAVCSQRSAVSIYPNPASTTITISLPSAIPVNHANLSIYDVNARQIVSQRITESATVLDIGLLPIGMYFVQVLFDDNKVLVGKFVRK
jgi:hypothetical protein